MRPRIQRLEGTIVDQIAAGEVVERPASVVKELLENAIDAGATSVTVDLEDGGRARIRVADDGHGMDRADARLAIERHATSKLRTAEDLTAIRTLGFRGEALPSIASVSRFTLTTRTHDSDVGTEVRVAGGNVEEVRDAGLSPGTIIDVRDLFYNVPARLKFLKSKPTEAGAVYDVALRVALANPSLRLTVTHDGRRVHSYLATKDLAERAATVFADEVLSPIEAARDGMRIHAMLGAPERARQGARWLHLFVNGRPIVDAKLARAISFAFGSVIPPGKYPVGVVHVFLPPDEVDVNAHPQKTEVRFARGAGLFESVTRALARELGTHAFGGPVARGSDFWDKRLGSKLVDKLVESRGDVDRELASTGDSFFRALEGPRHGTAVPSPDARPTPSPSPAATSVAYAERTVPVPSANDRSGTAAASAPEPIRLHGMPTRGFYGSLRFVGQVRRTFLVCEGERDLYVLDQHAVDERILYHRMRRAIAERTIEVQRLLFPERVELGPSQAELVDTRADELAAAGLECSRLGPATVAVHSVPALLARAKPATLLGDLLEELSHEGDRAFGDALDTAVATMACHAAIRAGDVLSPQECVALLHALDTVDAFAGHCPHGRPVLTSLAFDDLEKKLGR